MEKNRWGQGRKKMGRDREGNTWGDREGNTWGAGKETHGGREGNKWGKVKMPGQGKKEEKENVKNNTAYQIRILMDAAIYKSIHLVDKEKKSYKQ